MVRLVFDHAHQHESQWAAMRSVAEKIGCTSETLRHWVRQAERDTGRRPGLTTEERDRLLERENRELTRATEIVRQASAFFRAGGARPPTEGMVAFIATARELYGVEPMCSVLPIAPATYVRHKRCQADPALRSRRTQTRCVAHDTHPPGLGRALRRLWRSQNLATAGARRHRCRTLHGGALDATDGPGGRGTRAHMQDDGGR